VQVWAGGWTLADSAAPDWIAAARFVLGIVLAGACLRLIWILVGVAALRRYLLRAVPLPEPSPRIAELEDRLGCGARYLLSERVRQPITFGWRKPTVLLPASFVELDAQQQEAVICHELLHVKRRDWLPFLVEEAIRTAFWFHPAVWYLLSRLDLAREQVIDAGVLRLIGGRRLYLEVLLSFARQGNPRGFVPATPFFRLSHLGERVRAILAGPAVSTPRLPFLALTLLLLSGSAAGLAAWMLPLHMGPAAGTDGAAQPLVYVEDGAIVRPAKISGPAPRYTEQARKAHIQGKVVLQVTIDAEGRVVNVRPLQELDGGLTEAAMAAAADWKFEPATLDGRPVSVYYNLTVNFRLE
jgi:TonB family protein